jgi:hypothetical protein
MTNRSTFPNSLDMFTDSVDLSPSLKVSALRWQILKLQTSLTPAEQTEFNGLTTTLAPYLFTPEKLNFLQDAMANLENFTKNTLTQYYQYIGVYNPSTSYSVFNSVTYNGLAYLALQTTTGNPPSNNAYWLQIGSKGDAGAKGDPGANLVNKGIYSNTYAYNLNDLCQYNGVTYYCILASIGNLPTTLTYWSVFLSPPALPVTSTKELLITTTGLTTIVMRTPIIASNLQLGIYFRVITGTTVVSVQITYTDATGVQTLNLLTFQPYLIGSYTLPPIFINSTASAVTISIQAGTTNQVYASASILEVSI